MQALDWPGTFKVKSEIMKRLHRRFREEGIEINYPMRNLIFPDDAPSIFAPPNVTTSDTEAERGNGTGSRKRRRRATQEVDGESAS